MGIPTCIVLYIQDSGPVANPGPQVEEDDGELAPPRFPRELPQQWLQWFGTVGRNIRQHINPPAALGTGHRTLASKAAAEAYKMALQEPFGRPLNVHTESYASFTSDMGVEIGLADFAVPCGVDALLPSWFHRLVLGSDVTMGGEAPLSRRSWARAGVRNSLL